ILVSLPQAISKSLAIRRLRRENDGLRDEHATLTRMNEDYRTRLQSDDQPPQTVDLREKRDGFQTSM
ncbi:MAG TPA: hypothetical protein VF696_02695, partial [Candidatus Paceibacterota bacterium]